MVPDCGIGGETQNNREADSLSAGALALLTDVTDEAGVEGLVGRVLDELGGLDVLVNNSGVIHSAPLTETSPEEWDRVVRTNLRGTFLCMRAAGRHFLERGEAQVVKVASNFSFMNVPSLRLVLRFESGGRKPHAVRRGRVGFLRRASTRQPPATRRRM